MKGSGNEGMGQHFADGSQNLEGERGTSVQNVSSLPPYLLDQFGTSASLHINRNHVQGTYDAAMFAHAEAPVLLSSLCRPEPPSYHK